MMDFKKPRRFEELMRHLNHIKMFPIDLQPINPATSLEKRMREGQVPPLYSVEWFEWMERQHMRSAPLVPHTSKALLGIWGGRPVFWKAGEAWAFLDDRWERVNSADVGMNAQTVAATALEERFPNLPPLPAEAFKSTQD